MKHFCILLALGLWIILSCACADENNSEPDNAPKNVQKEMLQDKQPSAPEIRPPKKVPSENETPPKIEKNKDHGGWDEKSIYEKDEGC